MSVSSPQASDGRVAASSLALLLPPVFILHRLHGLLSAPLLDETSEHCHATLNSAHLYQVSAAPWRSVLGENREKKNVYFEHFPLPILTSPPGTHTLPVGTSKCVQGVSCSTQTHRETLKARCCRCEALERASAPAARRKQTHRAPSASLCRRRRLALLPSFLRINLTPELTGVGAERDRKLECHLLLLGISAAESAAGHSGGPREP